jgi:cell division protein FtsA
LVLHGLVRIKTTKLCAIPGLRGRDPKEITLKNLSKIIHARVTEIIESVYAQRSKTTVTRSKRKKLIAGVVLTGGGSQLKHLKQLVEYITGMDTRIGFPNEHLAGDEHCRQQTASPTFATAVGLVMKASTTSALKCLAKLIMNRQMKRQNRQSNP